MSSGYIVLPPVFDRWQKTYGKDFSTLILPRLLSTIREFRIPVGSMMDLACGTGTLALLMARRRWKVWGVDASEGMLRVASAKSAGWKLPVTFLCQDMRRVQLPRPVTLVTCMFDSINHLLSRRDLLAAFRAVHASLLPGGYFVFDVNNERCYRTIWGQTDVVHHKAFTLILRNSYDPTRHLGKVQVTLFRLEGTTYVRSDETVRERWYAEKELHDLLEQAGFRVRQREDFNFTAVREVGEIKTWWVAQR
jgi:SAM-dependent methyltransferase